MSPANDATPLVLIVDDDPDIRAILRIVLMGRPTRVVEAASGKEAMALVKDHRPDLIIMDWVLPELTGVEVTQALRREPDSANTPILMLTSKSEATDRRRGLEAGADCFLTKPFSPLEFLIAVDSALERRAGYPEEGRR